MYAQHGLGDTSSSIGSATGFLSDELITGIPNWALLLGGFVVYQIGSSLGSSGVAKSYRKRKSRSKKVSAARKALREAEES